ncbi:Phage-related protein endonuclease-like protein, partial [mine drainage metagenome]
DVPTPAMERGVRLEPMIIDAAAEILGCEMTRNIEVLHPGGIFAVNLDGCTRGPSPSVIVEAKSVASFDGWGEAGTDQVPDHYLIQVMFQLMVCRAAAAPDRHDFAWCAAAKINAFTGNLEVRLYRVDYDAALAETIETECLKFWERHVRPKIAPPDAPKNADTFRRILRQDGKTVELPSEWGIEYREIHKKINDLQADLEAVRARILARMGDADTALLGG